MRDTEQIKKMMAEAKEADTIEWISASGDGILPAPADYTSLPPFLTLYHHLS